MNVILCDAAAALEAAHGNAITVLYEGCEPAHPVLYWENGRFEPTPLQNATGGPLALAGWLHNQGGCSELIAHLHTDGSASVYRVEFDADGAPEDVVFDHEAAAPLDLDDCQGDYDLAELWDALETPILHVMEDGSALAVNVAAAQVRHFHGELWLYVDDTDGYSIVEADEVEGWDLTRSDDPRVRNEWDGQGNVLRDGRRIG